MIERFGISHSSGRLGQIEALDFTGLQTLEDRRESIAWKMFMLILHPDNCLNNCYLKEEIRTQSPDFEWHVRSYPLFKCRTERFKKSFFPMPNLISKVKQIHFLIFFQP